MAKADTSVKWFHSQMADAPVLNGQTGTGLGVLDACLVDGFSQRTPDSVIISNGVATVTISSGNPYEKHAVVLLSGASIQGLNGEWRIASNTANQFTFLCHGFSDGEVVGVYVRRAPGGWLKPFSGTNRAVYQSAKLDSTKIFLQVTDSTTALIVRGYTAMSDANTGTGEFPKIEDVAINTFQWRKSNSADSNSRKWIVATDGYFTWVIIYAWLSDTYSGGLSYGFGDVVSFVPNDAYHFFLIGYSGSLSAPSLASLPAVQPYSGSGSRYFARGGNQITLAPSSYGVSTQTHISGDYNPSFDGILRYFPIFQLDTNSQNSLMRGKLPGLYSAKEPSVVLQDMLVSEGDGSTILEFSPAHSSKANRQAAVDIMGPWR